MVRVMVPGVDGTPAPANGVEVVLLPYDRDSLVRLLEARATSPRPATAALDSAFARFREPFARYALLSVRQRTLQDSLSAAGADGRAALQARLDSVAGELAATARALEAARAALAPLRDSIGPRIRAWEDSTRRGYDSLSKAAAWAARQEPRADSTDAGGVARFADVPRARWWAVAYSWDVSDPNRQWYWNVPLAGDTVVLDPTNATRRPRY